LPQNIEGIVTAQASPLEEGDVRFGSKADIALGSRHVCFTPESGHRLSASGCPLWAKSRHRDDRWI
jgi:hypothetical protein